MSAENSEEERSLRQQVDQSERALDDLQSDLQSVDAELEALAERSHQYDVLADVCRKLEELDGIGAAKLFWDEQDGPDGPAAHLRGAHRKIDEFGEEIRSVEERRQIIVDKIGDQNDVLDYLHYDLRDALDREERRKNEWLVEREADQLPYRAQVMPWSRGFEEDQRFRKSLGMSLAGSLLLALIVGMVALPIIERSTVDELPERVAKLVRNEKTPPPPVPVEEPIIPKEEPPEPESQIVEELPTEPTEQSVVADVEQPETREQVKSKGILAFRDSFASRADTRPTAQLGSQARVRNAGEDAVGRPERMMVTTSAPGSSGGINLANISRDVAGGGQAIEGVQVSRVASTIGNGDGPDRPLSGGMLAGRTDEEIQIVFDRYKAALYRLYNRELRKDPTLRGQLVLRLTIEPDGSVSLCQLHTSDMAAPLLTQQVVDRVRTFDFGAKDDISAITIIYPIDFLPAA
ncbi:MAG: AgmX/PglI C-terminal domain-containing protein [Gammaproteobacteria bacterium]